MLVELEFIDNPQGENWLLTETPEAMAAPIFLGALDFLGVDNKPGTIDLVPGAVDTSRQILSLVDKFRADLLKII